MKNSAELLLQAAGGSAIKSSDSSPSKRGVPIPSLNWNTAPPPGISLPDLSLPPSSGPGPVVEHIRSHYPNYLSVQPGSDSSPGNGSKWQGAVLMLFQELLHNSIDEYLQGYGQVIDVLCSPETITIRDYGRGIAHAELKPAIQELGQGRKVSTTTVRYCEGFSGLGLRIANSLSNRFLIRSYRQQKFAEIETAEGLVLRERRGRCDKKDGVFFRLTPDAAIFGHQAVRQPCLLETIHKFAAMFPGLKLRLNNSQIVHPQGLVQLFGSLPWWCQQSYLYPARSLKGPNWQLSFSHFREWQLNPLGLHNERLIQSFVNGRSCCGGLGGGQHLLQLQGAFLGALRTVFPQRALAGLWDKGLGLFFSVQLLEPQFGDAAKTQLRGAEGEIAAIAGDCRRQLTAMLRQDREWQVQLEHMFDSLEAADEQGYYRNWQAELSAEISQTEGRLREAGERTRQNEEGLSGLQRSLRAVVAESQQAQRQWQEQGHQFVDSLQQAKNHLGQLQKRQRKYHVEQQRQQGELAQEREAYLQLKAQLQQQAEAQQGQQRAMALGLKDWHRLRRALEEAGELEQQRHEEQKRILDYLHSAKISTESQVQGVQRSIQDAEQQMLQRQAKYFQDLTEGAGQEHQAIEREIDQQNRQLRELLAQKQEQGLRRLHELQQNFVIEVAQQDQRWHQRWEQVTRDTGQQGERILERRRDVLAELDRQWREQETALEQCRQRGQQSLQCWQRQLTEGQKLAEAQQQARDSLRQGLEHIEQQGFPQQLQEAWTEQLDAVHALADRLQNRAEEQIQGRVGELLSQFENLVKQGQQSYEAQQKLLLTEQQTLKNELQIIQQEKDKLWREWQQEWGGAREESAARLAEQKEEWEQNGQQWLEGVEARLEKLKGQQFAQQHRIEEVQTEQTKVLKQLQQNQRDNDRRMSSLNKDLKHSATELRQEMEESFGDLRDFASEQFARVEQTAQDQAQLYRQGLWEKEEQNNKLLAEWNESFAQRLAEQKEAMGESLDQFRTEQQQQQQQGLQRDLEHWSEAFREEQSTREKQAAQEAQRRRSQFWRDQQSAVQQEVRQQRHEFQELHQELQTTVERERERLYQELQHLQQQTRQQEERLDSLSQNLGRDMEQRSERLRQELDDNYRQFYEEILGNTRELHQIHSEERRAVRDDLANMRRDVDDLRANMDLAEQTLRNLQKGLPDSLKLQQSLDELEQKEKLLRTVECEIAQLQDSLHEDSQIGHKTSEQLAGLLSRRNELSELEEQMRQVMDLSGDLYEQQQSLEQQRERIAAYQEQFDRLEQLYRESGELMQRFEERKEGIFETASLLGEYNRTLGGLEKGIQELQGQLHPLELGFGKK